jgi:molybdate transport system substrate-binding protein
MNPKRLLWIAPVIVLAAGLLAGCFPDSLTPEPVTPGPLDPQVLPTLALGPGEIVVAAASDLQLALPEISKLYETQTGNRVTLVFGSTGLLTQQIENGAPYDLFLSANAGYIQRLLEQDLVVEDSVELYAYGRLVIAVNRGSGVQASSLPDLLSPQVRNIAIANPDHAPYGLAARQALESAGLWDSLQDRLVLGDNVRQALQYVQSGDAQVGLVAMSIASVPEVSWMLVDSSLHQPLEQTLAVTRSANRPDIARQFSAFIASDRGRQVLYSYGFEVPGDVELLPTPEP